MVFRSLGVKRPRVSPGLEDRVPPGQYLTERWPVLHHGTIPIFDPATWDLRIFGLVKQPLRLSWEAFQALPRVGVTADMHCVTRWSKLDNTWEGVAFREIMNRVQVLPEATHIVFHSDGGYTANLPLATVDDDDVVLATKHDGEDLSPEHGAPLRSVVPKRYAWKSAKWLRGIEFLAQDRPGFWEQYGYHNEADPWREERFTE